MRERQEYTPSREQYAERLFPINRSITGEGVRESYKILQEIAPFRVYEVPSGTKVYDWEVPPEWNVKEAYIETPDGRKIADFSEHNLHLVGYSVPVDKKMPLEELQEHLHSEPKAWEAIPYRTTYYERNWGFCLPDRERRALKEGEYTVKIDSEIKEGSMTMGEAFIQGKSDKEYIISTYSCHPSMTNDNLSGMLVWANLLKHLREKDTNHSYRFIIGPETIGALTWLSQNEQEAKQVDGAIVLTSCAGWGEWAYKRSFKGDSEVDKAIQAPFKEVGYPANMIPFGIKGSDERQFSSPYFRIPTSYMCKPALFSSSSYHTSRDQALSREWLRNAIDYYKMVIDRLEVNRTYERTNPKGEPMMSKYDLYPTTGAVPRSTMRRPEYSRTIPVKESSVLKGNETDALMWVLFYADGEKDLFDISDRSGIPTTQLHEAAEKLTEAGLIK